MKRILALVLGVLVISTTVLILWPPARFRRWILAEASKVAAEKTPFEFTVGGMSGNILTGYVFTDVKLFRKSNHSEVFRTRSLAVRLNLRSLIRRRILQIDRLTLEVGGGQATLRGRLGLSPAPSGSFHIEDRDVALEKISPAASSLHSPLHLPHTGVWNVSLDSQVWTVDMSGRLDDAPVRLHGVWGPDAFYRLRGSWIQAPLYSVWRNPALRNVNLTSVIDLFGRHAAVNGTMDLQGQESIPSPGRWVRGHVRFQEGTGIFHLTLSMNGSQARARGNIQVPQRSLLAIVEADHLLWENRRLDKLAVNVEANDRRVNARATLQNLQWREGALSPGDVVSAGLSIRGSSPRWKTEASAQFRNGAGIEVAGQADHPGLAWTLTWDKLSASMPGHGVWTAKPGGSVSRRPSGQVDIRRLVFENGAQAVVVPYATIEQDMGQAFVELRSLDPAPWLALAGPDLSAEGTVNASFHVRGRFSHPNFDGLMNAKMQLLSMDSIGLALKDLEIDLRSSAQWLEVRRFIGKTKKGDIQISGRSQWPNLDFALQARELTLQTKSHSKGIGNATLHLSGTWNSPVVDGRITIKEAVYSIPKKAASPEPETNNTLWRRAALDVRADWARNVWYRDGVTSIETSADLRVQKARDTAPVRLTGFIRSVRGSYNYFGRDFNIDSGEIRFTGAPGSTPLLNIEASYRRDPTVVYLDITGTAEKPELKLRSSPPLSEQDIMSVIVFGQPLNELRSKTGGQSTNQASMQAAGGVLGSYLSKSLRKTGLEELNFDVLNIQPTQEGSQLTVGRYLTRKLFVSYGQAIRGSAEKSITADYFLTDKWTLQGASDSLQGNYMNLLFRYPLNRRSAAPDTPLLPTSPFRNTLYPLLPNKPKASGKP